MFSFVGVEHTFPALIEESIYIAQSKKYKTIIIIIINKKSEIGKKQNWKQNYLKKNTFYYNNYYNYKQTDYKQTETKKIIIINEKT